MWDELTLLIKVSLLENGGRVCDMHEACVDIAGDRHCSNVALHLQELLVETRQNSMQAG